MLGLYMKKAPYRVLFSWWKWGCEKFLGFEGKDFATERWLTHLCGTFAAGKRKSADSRSSEAAEYSYIVHQTKKQSSQTGWLFFVSVWYSRYRTRKAALSDLPVAGRNRRGFSAEKRVLGPPLLKKKRWIWGFSSAGRAPALQAGGQRFDPANLHQLLRDWLKFQRKLKLHWIS